MEVLTKKNFEKYPAYKDSGVEWLGEIPEGWEVKKLKFLISKISNGTTAEQLLSPNTFDNSIVRVTRIETISNEKIDTTKVGWIKKTTATEKFKLKQGDILFSHINSLEMVGKTALYAGDTELYSGMNLLRISPKKHINYYWLHYYFKSNKARFFFTSRAKPSINQASLPSSTVANYQVTTPPLPEQTAIAAFLDEKTAKIDLAISQKQRMISLLKERKQIMIQQAVTGKYTMVNGEWCATPEDQLKDSGVEWIGKIPVGWEVKRFKYLFAQSRLSPKKNDGVVTSYRDGEVTLRSNRRLTGYTEAVLEHGYQRVRIGQLVINSMDATDGAIGVSDSNGKCTPEYVICDKKIEQLSNHYYAYLLREMALAKYIRVICHAVRQRAIRFRFSNLSTQFVVIPPTHEQSSIVQHIKTQSAKIDKALSLQQAQIDKLKEYKAILIDGAVRGKIKVNPSPIHD